MPDPRKPDTATEDPGHPWLDVAKLQFAVRTVMSKEQIRQSQVAREMGLPAPKLNALLLHGDFTSRTLGLTLAWLHLDPAEFVLPAPSGQDDDVARELLAS